MMVADNGTSWYVSDGHPNGRSLFDSRFPIAPEPAWTLGNGEEPPTGGGASSPRIS